MQYFYYDPTFGLQYFCYENIFTIQFDSIPDFEVGDILDLIHLKGIVLENSNCQATVNEIGSIGSNMFDCNFPDEIMNWDVIEFHPTKSESYDGTKINKFLNDEIGHWPIPDDQKAFTGISDALKSDKKNGFNGSFRE